MKGSKSSMEKIEEQMLEIAEQTSAKKQNVPKSQKSDKVAYLWLLPAVLLLLVFGYYPPLKGLVLAFTDYSGGGGKLNFIGFANFIELFQDEQYGIFYLSLRNMVVFTITGLVLGNVMTIILAELLHNLRFEKLSSFFRFAFIIPILVPSVVSTLLWTKVIFMPSSTGLANQILAAFGLEPSLWYYSSESSMVAMILTGIPWVGGTGFLIYLAGLQGISPEIYEASRLDGCGMFRRIFVIDLPLIRGQIKYFIIMGVIAGLQNYSMQLIIQQDITNTGLVVPAYYMYSMAFAKGSRFGYASSIGCVVFVIALIITIINNKLLKSSEEEV